MALVHEQPVRWTHAKVAVCDGGIGPAGHPRIYINTDKPKICVCNYCGTPFVSLFPFFFLGRPNSYRVLTLRPC